MKMNLSSLSSRRGVVMEQHKEPALSRSIKVVGDKTRSIAKPIGKDKIDEISPAEIIEAAKAAKITDEHDGEYLWQKLRREAASGAIIMVDALDDEPYVSSQLGPMLQLREICVSGLRLAQKVLASDSAEILVYKNLTALEMNIPNKILGVPVHRIGGAYPAELYSNKYYADDSEHHYVTIGACSLIHLHRAVYDGLVQTTAFVTVAGNCVGSPRNIEIPIGATATEAFDVCGLIDEPTRIVAGGPLTGRSIDDTDALSINTATRALLAFREDERDKHFECSGCGRCIRCCPVGINPMMLYKAIDNGLDDLAASLDPQLCIGCMTCSYVCSAKLHIASKIADYFAEGRNQR